MADSCGGVAKGGGGGDGVPGDGAGKGEEGPPGTREMGFSAIGKQEHGWRADIKAAQSKENLKWKGGNGKPAAEQRYQPESEGGGLWLRLYSVS